MIKEDTDRIAFFLPTLGGGGTQRVVSNVVTGLHERRYDVELILAQGKGTFLEELPPEIPTIDLNAPEVSGLGIIPAIPELVRYLRTDPPAVLFSAMNHVNIPVILAWRIANVPVKLAISERTTPSSLTSTKNRMIYRAARHMYPWADTIVANSTGVANDLADTVDISREDIDVVYNPTVTPELFKSAKEPVNHPWFSDDTPPVVLGVGRLEEQKNFSTLINAFAAVRENRDARLVILGDGSLQSSLEKQSAQLGIEEDVDFPGVVDNPYKYMRDASVFVLSSAWEGLPNVLIEAMACGCPVVSTDCPSGPAEILDEETYGPLVPVGDAQALAESIQSVLDDPQDSERIRERAMDFSVQSVLHDFERVLVDS